MRAERPGDALGIVAVQDLMAEVAIFVATWPAHVHPHPPCWGGHGVLRPAAITFEAAAIVTIFRAVRGGHALAPVLMG